MENDLNISMVEEEIVSYSKENKGPFDLEERTFLFAQNVRKFAKTIPQNLWNKEDLKQLIRSSGSVGANYIEANEALSKKDFAYRSKISRKESKESRFFLRLLDLEENQSLETNRVKLIDEAQQLTFIFTSIIKKVQ